MKLDFILVASLAFVAQTFARDARSLSERDQSILQAGDEAAIEPGGFSKEDHLSGDWWGFRDRLQASGIEMFGFYNSILNGNASGGIHPYHATYVDDAWLGLKLISRSSLTGKAACLS